MVWIALSSVFVVAFPLLLGIWRTHAVTFALVSALQVAMVHSDEQVVALLLRDAPSAVGCAGGAVAQAAARSARRRDRRLQG